MSKARITCPNKGCLATLRLSENPENGRVLAAETCSLIEGEVDCDQECVRRINLRRERECAPSFVDD